MSFWRSHLTVPRSKALYQLNLTFVGPPTASVAIYGKKGSAPTVTNYDWAHIVSETGTERRMVKRAASEFDGGLVSVETSLSRGDW
jgi:hypothetical protein